MDRKKTTGSSAAAFLKKFVIGVLIVEAVAAAFIFALFHLIPASLYERLLVQELEEKTGLRIQSASFDTAFPLAFVLEGLKLYDNAGNELVRLETLRAGLNPLGYFGGLKISIDAKASGGQIDGAAMVGFFGSSFEMEARSVGFNAIPALERAGMKIDGTFDAMLVMKKDDGCPKGSLKVQGVEFKDAEFFYRGLPLPIDDIDEAGLSAEFVNCGVRVDGLWIEGRDLSARIKGDVKMASPLGSSPVDMTLELVPNEGLLKKEFLLSLLQRHRKSANYYSIPLKGTLGAIEAGQ